MHTYTCVYPNVDTYDWCAKGCVRVYTRVCLNVYNCNLHARGVCTCIYMILSYECDLCAIYVSYIIILMIFLEIMF